MPMALCDVRWKFSVHDCFARGVSRVRASCTVPRLRVRPLASNNEDLNSQNSGVGWGQDLCAKHIHARAHTSARAHKPRDAGLSPSAGTSLLKRSAGARRA
eukprot:scaffold115482_cov18-Phaeocystis_antarctica.AAC.1